MDSQELKIKVEKFLEQTKKQQEKYHEERITMFKLLENIKEPYSKEILENLLKIVEKNMKMEVEIDKIRMLGLETLKNNINKQKVRKNDKAEGNIILFKITDKDGKSNTFFTRDGAESYIKNNSGKYVDCDNIEIVENDNIDLENIINEI